MVEKRYMIAQPETPRRAKVTRLTRSETSGATKKNSSPSRCVCRRSSPSSGSCQFCDPVNSHLIASNENEAEESDNVIQQQNHQISKDIHSARICSNRDCNHPLPQDYRHKNCQSCIAAYRERYRDGKLACKGRCGARISRSLKSKFCSSCRKSTSPTKKNRNGKTGASHAAKEADNDDCDENEEENTVEVLGQEEKFVEVSDNGAEEAKLEALKNELRAYKDQLSKIAQEDIAEYAHLKLLICLIEETKDDFLHKKLSPEAIIETFENLAIQIEEAANRRLEHIPIGFESIMGIVSHGNAASYKNTCDG